MCKHETWRNYLRQAQGATRTTGGDLSLVFEGNPGLGVHHPALPTRAMALIPFLPFLLPRVIERER